MTQAPPVSNVTPGPGPGQVIPRCNCVTETRRPNLKGNLAYHRCGKMNLKAGSWSVGRHCDCDAAVAGLQCYDKSRSRHGLWQCRPRPDQRNPRDHDCNCDGFPGQSVASPASLNPGDLGNSELSQKIRHNTLHCIFQLVSRIRTAVTDSPWRFISLGHLTLPKLALRKGQFLRTEMSCTNLYLVLPEAL